MNRKFIPGVLVIALVLLAVSPGYSDEYLKGLKPDQSVAGFRTDCLYENSKGEPMGARFVSEKHGFVLDLLRIESVPQAFYWIKTPPSSSKGEPHSCEHLLLGKGNRGRYVAALEDMALGSSTAYTSQVRTCYHFNTTAGEKTFYDLFQAKLMALLHPDFTDEEVRREVCYIGIAEDPESGELKVEEKGTCYTEMVSSFEKPWYWVYGEMNKLVYGEDHPLTNISGGAPDVMRTMVPQDMWSFHKEAYVLPNMGAIVSIPSSIETVAFLTQMNDILESCEDNTKPNDLVGIGAMKLPSVKAAPAGTLVMTGYPSAKTEDPGYLLYTWPADLDLTAKDKFVLEAFLGAFAGGETSILYDLFINSQTRQMDIGGNAVFAGVDYDFGNSVYIGLTGLNSKEISKVRVNEVREMILERLNHLASLPADSPELAEFNRQIKSRMAENRKQYDNYLNSPPMFGFRRGPSGGWLALLETLENTDGFEKSLVLADRFAYLDSLLALGGNIWKDRLATWKIDNRQPYALGAVPDPEILKKNQADKEARLAGYVEDFKAEYGVADGQMALAKYREEIDANTAVLDELASHDELPGFIDNPPMTLDDQLQYEEVEVAGVPMMASTFDNMTAGTFGMAFQMDVVPESLLVYVPLLTSMMVETGVTKDGEIIPFDQMRDQMRNEVLGLDAYYDHGPDAKRIEMVMRARGNNLQELQNGLNWLEASLFDPYLSTENLPRIMDVIDQSLVSYRNVTKRSEEAWVNFPAGAYRFQENPLYLATSCFLTEAHFVQRMKWMLTDPGTENDRLALSGEIDRLAADGAGKSREELKALLDMAAAAEETEGASEYFSLEKSSPDSPEQVKKIARDVASAIAATLGDIPDETLSDDYQYLCRQFKQDLMKTPQSALAQINHVLKLIRDPKNVRMFMVSNETDRSAAIPKIEKLVARLDGDGSKARNHYSTTERVVENLKARTPGLDKPVYAGLVFEGTRNGVLLFSAEKEKSYDTDPDAVLDCLAGKLYGGGGPHGLFMKTWAAGLAYSNGYGFNQSSGRVSYYAERCPDVAQTMKFVVDLLKNAEDDPALTNYAIAQVFGRSRAPSRYESRGEDMANDLVDGILPDKVSKFRHAVLAMKDRDDLYEQLKSRMADAYGPVLIGYGQPLAQSKDGVFFLIGPEQQFESLEKYIATVEEPQPVYRLYPRDFWITGNN